MKTSFVVAVAACLATLAGQGACAAGAAAPPPPSTAASAVAPMEASELADAGEPAVRRTIIDDGRARIEELRVRGQLQKVTVAPKGRIPGYEILLGDGAHAIGDDPGTSRGSAGKRVWKVLRF